MVSIMTGNVLDDLKMAEISLAKVADVDKMHQEARQVLDNFRTTLQVKEDIQNALTNLESKEDYQITPSDANRIDSLIRSNSDMIVSDGKAIIAGTESFGVNITPKEWRASRSIALREMLSETYKNIKRWANQLADNFQRTWLELMTSTDVLESRLEAIDSTLSVVERIREGCTEIEINEVISRSLSKGGRVLSGDIAKGLQGEINYITSCLRLWEMEQIRFKNTTIRYFGNDRNTDITMIDRQIPKLFTLPVHLQEDEYMLTGKQSMQTVGGFSFVGTTLDPKWIRDNIKGPEDNTLYADTLSKTGFYLNKADVSRVGKTTMPVLTLTQLFIITDLVRGIVDRLKTMNIENAPVNFNPDDVKDVLNTLRNGDSGQDRAYQYGLITADYQFNVNAFKTEVSNMMTVLASHLLTLINHHLGCYDVK